MYILNLSMFDIPETCFGVPLSSDSFDFLAQLRFVSCNPYGHHLISRKFLWRRLPVSSFYYQLNRFQTLPCRGIIPESYTYEFVTVFVGQPFGATLAWF